MPIWLKRAPASILIFFSLVPEVIGTVSDWERTAVPQAKSRNRSGDGGRQSGFFYCEQQNQSHHHPERFRPNCGSSSSWTATPLLTFWRCLRPAPTVVHTANLDDIHDVRVRDFFIVGETGAYLSRIAQWIPCDNDPRSRHQRGLRWAGYAAVCQPLQ